VRKACLVAQGFSQHPGVGFTETFAPTTKWAALRTVFALATTEDMEMELIDISNAYLNGMLQDVDVYMCQPEGFESGNPGNVAHLDKGLYGLHQGGCCWYNKLDKVLAAFGFICLQSDLSIFIWERNGIKVIVPVFVDNILLVSKSKEKIAELKTQLASCFKLRDLGPTSFVLGVEVLCDQSQCTLCLLQCQYALDLLVHFGFADCSPVSTPINDSCKLSHAMCPLMPEELAEMKDIPYINAVGALMFLAVSTHPDIAYAVGVLCCFIANPGMAHWHTVKHLFQYIKGTLDHALTYSPDSKLSQLFTTFSDADHGGNPDSGKSTSAYVAHMASCHNLFSRDTQTTYC
jgi:hypothetical protein